ncbi:MAG: tetratricopeptide repeat protein [Verrucomicrobiota bacterium]
MRRARQFVLWLLAGLVLAGARLDAADSRAFKAATDAMRMESWDYADARFGEFIQKNPKSSQLPQAILYQAQARYHLRQFPFALELLSTNEARAGRLQDQYVYWMGHCEFQMSNYAAAAAAFGRAARDFPGSTNRLDACVAQATALARLGDWKGLLTELQDTNGVFAAAAKLNPEDPLVVRGYLLQGEAQLAQNRPGDVEATLGLLSQGRLSPELGWRREYLRSRAQLAARQYQEALQTTTNLLILAGVSAPGTNASAGSELLEPDAAIRAAVLLPVSRAFQAGVLEQLGRRSEAIAVFEGNLDTNAPAEQQRRALWKIAELQLAQGNPGEAVDTLREYLIRYPDAEAADTALLAIGELQLKQAVAANPPSSNLVQQASTQFRTLAERFPNSHWAAKAMLNQGWCLWLSAQLDTNSAAMLRESGRAFEQAARQLPLSYDQAVALFKAADARFLLKDYAAALTNYLAVASQYGTVPEVQSELLEPALYQAVQSALDAGDLASAVAPMQRLLREFPGGFAGPHCLLLVGQGLVRGRDPAAARALYADFESKHPTNALLPEVRLAVARSYEEEKDWTNAIAQYGDWVRRFTNHAELPAAAFALALDYSRAGQSTNALAAFTAFVDRFPTNALAQQAQWWVGGYYFGQNEFAAAENRYQYLYKTTNWPPSELTFQAQMMAGRAAMASLNYSDAIRDYFMPLANNTNCSEALRDQALFAWADALVIRDSTNKPSDYQDAIEVFQRIAHPGVAPSNSIMAAACGGLADCYLQLAVSNPPAYLLAKTNFQIVIDSPSATVAARSQAGVGLGRVAEALAALAPPDQREELLKEAQEDYLDVFLGRKFLLDGEQPDLFWTREAGLKAAALAEKRREWKSAVAIYERLAEWFPSMKPLLEPRILRNRKAEESAAK